jgi:hypothetical protein
MLPSFGQSYKCYEKLKELNTSENILVSHNAPFDVAMFEKEGFTWQGSIHRYAQMFQIADG